MSKVKNSQLFLERKSYRQRRLRDAVRVMPVLGGILWLMPLMWTSSEEAQTQNSEAMLYIFGVWVVLIGLSALVSRALRPETDNT